MTNIKLMETVSAQDENGNFIDKQVESEFGVELTDKEKKQSLSNYKHYLYREDGNVCIITKGTDNLPGHILNDIKEEQLEILERIGDYNNNVRWIDGQRANLLDLIEQGKITDKELDGLGVRFGIFSCKEIDRLSKAVRKNRKASLKKLKLELADLILETDKLLQELQGFDAEPNFQYLIDKETRLLAKGVV